MIGTSVIPSVASAEGIEVFAPHALRNNVSMSSNSVCIMAILFFIQKVLSRYARRAYLFQGGLYLGSLYAYGACFGQ